MMKLFLPRLDDLRPSSEREPRESKQKCDSALHAVIASQATSAHGAVAAIVSTVPAGHAAVGGSAACAPPRRARGYGAARA